MNKKIIFLTAAAVVYIFFYALIPVPFIYDAEFFWAFFGGILSGICIFLAARKNDDEMYDMDKFAANKSEVGIFILIAVVVAIVGSAFIGFHYYTRETAFLKKNPVMTDATIIDGVSKTNKNGSDYTLQVTYKDAHGRFQTKYMNVSSKDWDNAAKNMPVKLVYEKDHPFISKVLLTESEALEYLGKDAKLYPGVNDLVKIIHTAFADSLDKQTAIIGDGWGLLDDPDHSTPHIKEYYNAITGDHLVVSSVGYYYINTKDNPVAYRAIMAEAVKNMHLVYDSMATNKKKGMLLENDSISLHFQEYTRIKKEDDTENQNTYPYRIRGTILEHVHCIGFVKKGAFVIMPGDFEESTGLEQLDKITNRIKNNQDGTDN